MTFAELITNIKVFEGFRSKKYYDSGNVATIGYGFTSSVFPNAKVPDTITKVESDDLLEKIISELSLKVSKQLLQWGYTENEHDILLYPLTDFAYNCGLANLTKLTKSGTRTMQQIRDKITEYVNCNGKPLTGLVVRRTWEQQQIDLNINHTEPVYTVAELQKKVNYIMGYQVLKIDNIFGKNTLKYTIDALNKLSK